VLDATWGAPRAERAMERTTTTFRKDVGGSSGCVVREADVTMCA
jgi:hypothetical protein